MEQLLETFNFAKGQKDLAPRPVVEELITQTKDMSSL